MNETNTSLSTNLLDMRVKTWFDSHESRTKKAGRIAAIWVHPVHGHLSALVVSDDGEATSVKADDLEYPSVMPDVDPSHTGFFGNRPITIGT